MVYSTELYNAEIKFKTITEANIKWQHVPNVIKLQYLRIGIADVSKYRGQKSVDFFQREPLCLECEQYAVGAPKS